MNTDLDRIYFRFWATVIGLVLGIDAYAAYIRHDGTLSHVVRTKAHTDTSAGRVRLCVGWALLSALLLPHWCKWPSDRLPAQARDVQPNSRGAEIR